MQTSNYFRTLKANICFGAEMQAVDCIRVIVLKGNSITYVFLHHYPRKGQWWTPILVATYTISKNGPVHRRFLSVYFEKCPVQNT